MNFDRFLKAQRKMRAFMIVKPDGLSGGQLGMRKAKQALAQAIFEFKDAIDRVPTGRSQGIVITVADLAHAGADEVLGQGIAIGMAGVLHPMIAMMDQAVMLSVLLGIIGLTVWEIHRRDKNRFPDFIVISILGLLLPFGFLLLFFFDMRPLVPSLTFVAGEIGLFAALSIYVLSLTLLLATVVVRQPTVLTIPGVLGLSVLLILMLVTLRLHLWLGSAIDVGLLLLWYLWGRSSIKRWHQVHPSVDLLGLTIIAATVLGIYTPVPLLGNVALFALVASVLIMWAYQQNETATQNTLPQNVAWYIPFIRWGIVTLGVVGVVTAGVFVVQRNLIDFTQSLATPTAIATNVPTVAVAVNPTTPPTVPATFTPTATTAVTRLSVERSAPGANRYFIEGPDLSMYELEDLLAVYARDSAGYELDAAVVLVVDKNVGNLIVQVIFQNKNYPLNSLAALQLDDQLKTVDLEQMTPVNDAFVGFMLEDKTIRLAPNAKVAVGDQLEAVQLTRGGDTLPFSAGRLMVHIDSMGTGRKVARVSSTGELPPLGTLLVLATESPTSTPSPAPSPTQVVTPTTTATPTPEPQPNLPIDESFDGIVKLTWENAQGEWGVNNQRLQVRRFEDRLAGIWLANPDWPRYVVQLDFGTIKHLDDSGNVNVPFSNFHVLIHFQGNTDGYWFTVANGGVACTLYKNKIPTRLTPSTNQWGEMFDLLARSYTGDHKLKITVRDNQYTFMLNEEEICRFQDDTYPVGRLGIVVSEGASGKMWIDNVRITPLD